jgi:hypothetical protein
MPDRIGATYHDGASTGFIARRSTAADRRTGSTNEEMIMAGNEKRTGKQGKPDQGNKQSTNQGSSQSETAGRGFASMDPDKQRAIASEGGRAAHAAGTAHEFTSQEAREAGRMSHKNDGNQQSGQGNRGGQPGKK